MKARMKRLSAAALILALFCLASCADPRMLGTVELELRTRTLEEITSVETKEEAARVAEMSLKAAKRGYRWKVRRSVWVAGASHPCYWVIANNDYGEHLDLLFVSAHQASVLGWISDKREDWKTLLAGLRRVEEENYCRNLDLPEDEAVTATDWKVAENREYVVFLSGNRHALRDVGALADAPEATRPSVPLTDSVGEDGAPKVYRPAAEINEEYRRMAGRMLKAFRSGDTSSSPITWQEKKLWWQEVDTGGGVAALAFFAQDADTLYRLASEPETAAALYGETIQPGSGPEGEYRLPETPGTVLFDASEYGYGWLLIGPDEALTACLCAPQPAPGESDWISDLTLNELGQEE